MNNRKSILFLLAVIAAIVFVDIGLRQGRQNATRVLVRTSLIKSVDGVSRLEIIRAGFLPVVLERTAEWRIVSPYAGSVDGRFVAKLLDKLAFSPIIDVIVDAELLKLGRTRADFTLSDPLVKVTVTGNGESESVSFGAPTPSADGVYAAVEGVNAVFVVPSEVLAEVDRPADSFRRRSLFNSEIGTVSAFDIKRGTGSMLSFVRTGDGWSADGKQASEQKVRQFLAGLSEAVAVEFIWPVGASNEMSQASTSLLAGYGLDPESAVTVSLKRTDGADRQVVFGKNADEKHVFALVQGGSAIVTLPSELKDAAMQDQLMFADARIFPVDANSVAFISVAEGDTVYALARGANGAWTIESPIIAGADDAAARDMLARVLALSPADIVSSGVSVSISTNAAPVVVARESVLGKGGFERLRSREMVRIDPLLVKRISRTSDGSAKPVSVIHSRERKLWNVESANEGKSISEDGVATVLAALNPLVAVQVVKLKVPAGELAEYGFDKPFMTIVVDQDREDAVRRNILIGDQTKGGRFATVGSADAVFVISDSTVKKLSVAIVER